MNTLLVSLYVWAVTVSFGIVLLMLRDIKRRFSLRWLFAFTTFVAVFFGSVAALFNWLQSQAVK